MPRPPRPCLDCGRLTNAPSLCTPCKRQRDKRRGTTTHRGYDYQWSKLSAQVRAEEPNCYLCGAPSTATDHVIPKNRGGTNDRTNLRGICTPCNSAKRDR